MPWDAGAPRPLEPFHKLEQWRVREILLVASPYDAFILEQDGQLGDLIEDRWLALNLQEAPRVHRVSTAEEALFAAGTRPFDLLIATTRTGDRRALDVARAVRTHGLDLPVVALAYDDREPADLLAHPDAALVDRFFVWQGDVRILLAIVKELEDRRNAPHDILAGGVQAVLLVEDSARFYSSYLPLLFAELLRQSQSVLSEGISLTHKLLLMKARPKVLFSTSFESAWEDFERYRDQVLGVISDVDFPRGGSRDPTAGLELSRRVKEAHDDIPVLLQSTDPGHEAAARAGRAGFLRKDSPRLLQELRDFMRENFSFGDFVFRHPDGQVVDRAWDLRGLEERLLHVPEESIRYHAERNHFSNWLKARAEFALAERLRPRRVSDYTTIEDLRQDLIGSLRAYRREIQRDLVADFDASRFDPQASFARLGGGSLGGKARGLAFLNVLLSRYRVRERFPGVAIGVPPCLVLTTDLFDRWLQQADLTRFAAEEASDEEIDQRFLNEELPASTLHVLEVFLEAARYPLAVRSSSLLEDSQFRPLAGVYETVLLANDGDDLAARVGALSAAIRRVYASTFRARARSYLRATPYRLEEEKMAVVVQRLTGRRHGDRFYPDFSGTARSVNHYPVPPAAAEDGVAAAALGLGQMVVQGGRALRFCPRYPRHLPPTEQLLAGAPRTFLALSFDGSGTREWDLDAAAADGTLDAVASTWSADDQALRDGVARGGAPLVTFAPVLKHEVFPLAAILEYLLDMGRWAMGGPVEFEFAVSLTAPVREFALVQIRPLAPPGSEPAVDLGEVPEERVLARSDLALGNGAFEGIRDVVYLPPARFDRSRSREAAREVTERNATLREAERPYLLIGVGRWGSADPWLGIPVTWDMISGARVIVETCFPDLEVTPSQGTHFFQNLTAAQAAYLTIHPRHGDAGRVDWDWLARQSAESEGLFVRHVRLDAPLRVLVDGRRGAAVVGRPE